MDIEKFIKNFNTYSTWSYTLYFPNDRHSTAIMESPLGIFQIIDFIIAYDGKTISGNYEDRYVFTPDELKKIAEEEDNFLKILVNINDKHGGVFVENDQWLCLQKEKHCDDFFIFFRCIPNSFMKNISNIIFYLYKNKIKTTSISEENYDLLKNVLSYGTKENR